VLRARGISSLSSRSVRERRWAMTSLVCSYVSRLASEARLFHEEHGQSDALGNAAKTIAVMK
jgi:hypothetical protein